MSAPPRLLIPTWMKVIMRHEEGETSSSMVKKLGARTWSSISKNFIACEREGLVTKCIPGGAGNSRVITLTKNGKRVKKALLSIFEEEDGLYEMS